MKIEIYEIKNADCKEKESRKWLIKSVMKVLKLEEKPDKKYLEKVCSKLQKKYKIVLSSVVYFGDKAQLNIKTKDGSFSCMFVSSYYEAMLKYILYVYATLKNEKEKVK